jgi:hypothetical protein
MAAWVRMDSSKLLLMAAVPQLSQLSKLSKLSKLSPRSLLFRKRMTGLARVTRLILRGRGRLRNPNRSSKHKIYFFIHFISFLCLSCYTVLYRTLKIISVQHLFKQMWAFRDKYPYSLIRLPVNTQ